MFIRDYQISTGWNKLWTRVNFRSHNPDHSIHTGAEGSRNGSRGIENRSRQKLQIFNFNILQIQESWDRKLKKFARIELISRSQIAHITASTGDLGGDGSDDG